MTRPRGGAIALIAPGTGLGEAFLTWDGARYREHATEGGHADFAPAKPAGDGAPPGARQRVSITSVMKRSVRGRDWEGSTGFSGRRERTEEPAWLAARLAEAADPAPIIVEAALAGRSALCVRTVRLFVSILGAEAGNLALKTLATGGVYIGGGIAPRIIPFLEEGPFLAAFRRKGPMADLLFRMPVHVILEPRAALIGAADCGLADV